MSSSSALLRTFWLAFGLAWFSAPAQAAVIINFESIAIPGDTELVFFQPYQESGFTITATNPPTGLSAGFEAHGQNSVFFAGSQALAALPPANAPFNIIELTQDSGLPFNLLSIDLARNFPFDPAPTVTFTGTLAGGGELMQTFTVSTPPGVAAFQTFQFTGFNNLVSVRWGQPVLLQGIHQFDNIEVQVIPEPPSMALCLIGVAAIGVLRLRRRAASLRAGGGYAFRALNTWRW